MKQFPEASDMKQERRMPKERVFRVLKRNSTTSAVPRILKEHPSLRWLQAAHTLA